MREKAARESLPTPAAFINAQSAITGLRGRDLISTLRSVAAHGLRNPVHTARHVLKLGGQLGRVLLGDTLHPTNRRTVVSTILRGASTLFIVAACRPT